MSEQSPRIVIIGAGVSGIAAASRLIENGFNNIKILEAENRVGGRIYSTKFGNGIVELGAMNIREGSVVYNLVKDFDLMKEKTAPLRVYHSQYGLLADTFTSKLLQRFDALYLKDKSPETSWKQHLIDNYQKCILDQFIDDKERVLVEDSLHFLENMLLVNTTLFSLSEGGERRVEYAPDFKFVLKNKEFQLILDILMKKLGNDPKFEEKIFLNCEVTKIDWNATDGDVKVTSSDGKTHSADYVITTIPLGPLKKHYKTLFSPRLSNRKENAIELLGFQGLLKIWFHFPNKWWSNHDMFFNWSKEDLQNIEFKRGPSKNGKSWITSLLAFYIHPDNPSVLLAAFGGDLFSDIELTSADILLDGVHYITQKFLGSIFENITRPDQLKFYNWYTNPHFGGISAVETLESKRQGVTGVILAEPEHSADGKLKLLFAGEAANGVGYGSVNASIIAGFREADRIMNLYAPETK